MFSLTTTTSSLRPRCVALPSTSPTMMLIRQLPAGSMTMSLSSISLPSFPGSLPSKSSFLLSLLASVVLLSFIRAAVLCLRTNVAKQPQQLVQALPEKKESTGSEKTRQRRSSWAWGLISWESLPLTLPVSLTMAENNTNGRGVGLQEKRRDQSQSWQPRVRRGGPAFESPSTYHLPLCSSPSYRSSFCLVPAIYQSEVPVSMAKMIMSRHVRIDASTPHQSILTWPFSRLTGSLQVAPQLGHSSHQHLQTHHVPHRHRLHHHQHHLGGHRPWSDARIIQC